MKSEILVPHSPAARPHRLLFLLHSSVFDQYGGVEYYLDDFIDSSCSIYGADQLSAVVARRTAKPAQRPYPLTSVNLSKNSILQKIENRVSLRFFEAARQQMVQFSPSLIVNSHVSLGPVAYSLHRLFRIPFVTLVYGIDCWGNLWPQDEWSLKKASGIVSISEWTKKVLTDRGYPEEQIQVVHPKMATEFEVKNALAPRKWDRPFTLLTIARLDAREQYKGQDHVMQALSLLKQRKPELAIRYVIQGEGTDKARLEALRTTLSLESIVEFRPPEKERGALDRLYSEADVFIMPSRFGCWNKAWRGEGFGIVYVEAAAFGVPSIAYRCGGATDIIQDQETGLLVEPDNIEALARAIESLASQPEKTKKMGEKAKRDVAHRFTTPAFQEQIVRAFNRY